MLLPLFPLHKLFFFEGLACSIVSKARSCSRDCLASWAKESSVGEAPIEEGVVRVTVRARINVMAWERACCP